MPFSGPFLIVMLIPGCGNWYVTGSFLVGAIFFLINKKKQNDKLKLSKMMKSPPQVAKGTATSRDTYEEKEKEEEEVTTVAVQEEEKINLSDNMTICTYPEKPSKDKNRK